VVQACTFIKAVNALPSGSMAAEAVSGYMNNNAEMLLGECHHAATLEVDCGEKGGNAAAWYLYVDAPQITTLCPLAATVPQSKTVGVGNSLR
jgi:hypothetical protein